MIPDEAVEAAADWLPHSGDCEARPERDCTCRHPRVAIMRAALDAALPTLLSHEREETRLAHIDAVVNAESLSKYENVIDALDKWAGRSKSAYYDEAQDDVLQIIRDGLK